MDGAFILCESSQEIKAQFRYFLWIFAENASQNCLHIYRKNVVSYKIALVNYVQKSMKILTL